MTENIAVSFTIEIEVCVVGKINDCRSISLCSKSQTKFVLLCPLIACNSLQGTGITHFSIL